MVSIIFSACLKLMLWNDGWAITLLMYARGDKEEYLGFQEELLYSSCACSPKAPWEGWCHRGEKKDRLTCSLLLSFQVFFLFVICCLRVEVIVGVFRQFPLIVLIHQVRSPAGQICTELLNVDLHNPAVNSHSHLQERVMQSWSAGVADTPGTLCYRAVCVGLCCQWGGTSTSRISDWCHL